MIALANPAYLSSMRGANNAPHFPPDGALIWGQATALLQALWLITVSLEGPRILMPAPSDLDLA